MPQPTLHRVTLGKREYPLLYSSNAFRRLEKETDMPIGEIGARLRAGLGGWGLLHVILWAGLEGGRIRTAERNRPFTVDEVGDLIDAEGGASTIWDGDGTGDQHPVLTELIEAWGSAFPKPRKPEEMPRGATEGDAARPTEDATPSP